MNRIFYPLALFAVVALLGVLVLGLYVHAHDIRNPNDDAAQRLATAHRLSGIATGVIVLLVNSVVVTYFVGTSRWCKEVAETYRLDRTFVGRSSRLKRRTFPISVVSMLIVVGITALGGAADPGAALQRGISGALGENIQWADIHLFAAVAGTAVIAVGFYFQAAQIDANSTVINDVMSEVKRIRAERGLPG